MASDSRTFLATTVLNEEQSVTYRALSRALKVHCNVAKEMLYQFHRQQKPGSVHATYLLGGTRRPSEPTESDRNCSKTPEEQDMQSSPFMGSSTPKEARMEDSVPVRCLTLVREEDFETAKAQFEGINSIHIYSLEPRPFKDPQILSASNRRISGRYANEDPLIYGKQYGVIQNSSVKRRTGKRSVLPPDSAVTPPKYGSMVAKNVPDRDPRTTNKGPKISASGPTKTSEDGNTRPKAEKPIDSSQKTEKKQVAKAPVLPRNQSDIFKSFSKSRSNLKREDTDSSVAASPTTSAVDSVEPNGPEDEPMKDASEDEQEADFATGSQRTDSESMTHPKAQREEELRRMMDEEDVPILEREKSHAENGDAEQLPDAEVAPASDATEACAMVPKGRRRGRRRIMKKKTIKDEEGYLVTKEEPVWESFSEDDSEPPKVVTQAPISSSGAKGKKGTSKPGQGNIRSFFTKK